MLKREGFSNTLITERLGVHRPTIGRELERNGLKGRYGAATADRRANVRRSAAIGRTRRFTPEMRQIIEQKLRDEQWSPEQIRDHMRAKGHDAVSHERKYQHLWADFPELT